MRALKWTEVNKDSFKKLGYTYTILMRSFHTIMGNYSWGENEIKAFGALEKLMYDGGYATRDWVGTLYYDSVSTAWCEVLHAMKDHNDPIIINTIMPRLIDCITQATVEIALCEIIDVPAEECINTYYEERGEYQW